MQNVQRKGMASLEGIFAAPEGAATVIAARKLAASGWIKPDETVVLFNTGTGYKYSEAWQRALQFSSALRVWLHVGVRTGCFELALG